MDTEERYSTDLTDGQWEVIRALLPEPKKKPDGPGRPSGDVRRVVDGILYANRTGCQWRLVPKHFGHWNTVYSYFNRWSEQGVWKQIMEELRHRERARQGRDKEPSAGCVDSQSVKTTTYGNSIGYDGGKKTKGRKRHILVDTLDLLVVVVVTAANQGDRDGKGDATLLRAKLKACHA